MSLKIVFIMIIFTLVSAITLLLAYDYDVNGLTKQFLTEPIYPYEESDFGSDSSTRLRVSDYCYMRGLFDMNCLRVDESNIGMYEANQMFEWFCENAVQRGNVCTK